MTHWHKNELDEIKIPSFMDSKIACNDFKKNNSEMEDEDLDTDNDKKLKKHKFHDKNKLTDREYRDLVTKRKGAKHRFAQFHELAQMLPIISYELLEPILNGPIWEQASKQFFTLYDILCYIFINRYGDKIDYNENEYENISLNELVTSISYVMYVDKYGEKEDDDSDETSEDKQRSIFDSFKSAAIKQLDEFFEVIFDDKYFLDRFKINRSISLNLVDYGFITYLLSDSAKFDFLNFRKRRFYCVSPTFLNRIYLGVRAMLVYHNVEINTDDFKEIWRERILSKRNIKSKIRFTFRVKDNN